MTVAEDGRETVSYQVTIPNSARDEFEDSDSGGGGGRGMERVVIGSGSGSGKNNDTALHPGDRFRTVDGYSPSLLLDTDDDRVNLID